MKFCTSWVDTANRNINFVTELFTSGTLRQYRLKHKKVNVRAIKNWCRQILEGLVYLHSLHPPVIHRDLKCDNIFINGNQGEVKIGDLGLAAILRKSHAAHIVGTPEFMAPEVYDEEYNELVDIYSFGMSILEMVTFEYPYSECTNPAQIYKKVVSGKKPDALYKVKDPEVRQFVEKCLANVSCRLSARELLNDPFLQIDNCELVLIPIEHREMDFVDHSLRQISPELDNVGNSFSKGSLINGYSSGYPLEDQNGWGDHPVDIESGIQLFEYDNDDVHDEHLEHVGITIKGKRREDGWIFLRLRISDKEGKIRNIYFPFDVESDTALGVATEMVAELDITDQDVTKIAEMIGAEISSLMPEWLPVQETGEMLRIPNTIAKGSFMNFLPKDRTSKNLQAIHSSGSPCAAATHGRFEEISYQIDSPRRSVAQNSTDNNLHHSEMKNLSSLIQEEQNVEQTNSVIGKDGFQLENKHASNTAKSLIKSLSDSFSLEESHSLSNDISNDYEHKIRQEMRWLKAKYQIELREIRNQHLGLIPRSPKAISSSGTTGKPKCKNKIFSYLASKFLCRTNRQPTLKCSNKKVEACIYTFRAASIRHPKLP